MVFSSHLGQNDGVAGVGFLCYSVNRFVFRNCKFSLDALSEVGRGMPCDLLVPRLPLMTTSFFKVQLLESVCACDF